jgi:hypothetical protein
MCDRREFTIGKIIREKSPVKSTQHQLDCARRNFIRTGMPASLACRCVC